MKKLLMTTGFICAAGSAFANPMQINICAGSEKGVYTASAKELVSRMPTNVKATVVFTEGSVDNIRRLTVPSTAETQASGAACDVMFAQPDSVTNAVASNRSLRGDLRKVGNGPLEYVQLICNADLDIDDLSDLEGTTDYAIAIGKEGSGAWSTWQSLLKEADGYASIPTTPESGILALGSVAEGAAGGGQGTACVLITAAVPTPIVVEADTTFAGKLKLLSMSGDRDFNDAVDLGGKPLYHWQSIPKGSYPTSLQTGWFASVETIAWKSHIYVSKEKFQGNDDALAAVIRAAALAEPTINAAYGILED